MISQWPSVLSLFKGYLYLALLPLNLGPNEMSWHPCVLSLARTQTHTRAHEQALLRAPEVRSETVGGEVRQHGCTQSWREWLKHTDSICACMSRLTYLCQRGEKNRMREKKRRWKREQREKERPKNSILANLVFKCSFFPPTNSSSFFLPLQFSWRQCIDFILGLSYHLAAFHSSVFTKHREHRERQRERVIERKPAKNSLCVK